jgi:hypothetical protein
MTAVPTRWTELLSCSNCRLTELAHLSQPKKRAFDFRVDAVPEGFKIVRLEFGETFYCQACDRQAHAG